MENMKDRILALRGDGYSYNKIVEELGCSKGTVAYHCGDGQKQKYRDRQRKCRLQTRQSIRSKIDRFLRGKVREFKLAEDRKSTNGKAGYDTFYKKIIENPVCYLTGRDIDLSMPRTYNLDHIVPLSKGGIGTLDNMGLTSRNANMSKFDMTLEEYIALCKEVLENFGYTVSK